MNLSLNLPINKVSFGVVSTAILREFYSRGLFPTLFPISQVDLSAQKPLKMFEAYVGGLIGNTYKTHNRNNPSLKLWHLNGSLEGPVSKNKNFLLTFHETDQITDSELNVINQYDKLIVTSKYTKQVFENYGARNIEYIDLGFDTNNFWKTGKKAYTDDRITFGLFGKLEHRKHHIKILRAWAKKYGNNPKYCLHAAIFNPFLSPEDQTKIIMHGLEGRKYFNINFIPFVNTNAEYNDIVNSCDIVLALSGNEGFGMPEFHGVGLGKHCVALDAHSYQGFLNNQNSVMIKPKGMIPVYDGIFFHQGQPFNQGNIYTWNEDEMLNACDIAINRFENNPINIEGLKLQNRTYSDTFDQIHQIINAC